MLKTRIKASQVTNLTDARYFAAWEVTWIGFNFDEGTLNYITPTAMKAIRNWIAGPKIVGEFSFQLPENLSEAVAFLGLDAVQVGHFTDLDAITQLQNIPIIKEIVIDLDTKKDSLLTDLKAFAPHVVAFVFDFEKNKISWDSIKNHTHLTWLKSICQDYAVILNIDLTPTETLEVIETLQPYGLNLIGGDEEKVGFKSFDELDDIFELLYEEVD